MPSHRTSEGSSTYEVPGDFTERLERFKDESGLTWAELNRQVGTHPQTMRRWRKGETRPSTRHVFALLDLADSMGLGHLFNR